MVHGRLTPFAAQRRDHFGMAMTGFPKLPLSIAYLCPDHCIDYLRQVIMCHGDITPITFEWSNERSNYLARHGTEHQCRNFDAIFYWAQGRHAGMAVDGDHENVELETPEMSD